MADTNISWTDAVWNPTSGCAEVSPGCKNCYAKVMHKRLTAMGAAKYTQPFHQPVFHPDALAIPLKWRKPRRIFTNSMSDLFYDSFSNEQIAAVFGVMAATPQHTYQVLTKRPERALKWFEWLRKIAEDLNRADDFVVQQAAYDLLDDEFPLELDTFRVFPWPLPNVHLLVSCEDQQRANERIPLLLQCPAAVRGLSLEPLLGPIDLRQLNDGSWYDREGAECYNALRGNAYYRDGEHGLSGGPVANWVIVGAESGPKRRPCDIEWIRSLRSQCEEAGVPLFVKQLSIDGKVVTELDRFPSDLQIRMFPGDKW